MLGRAFQVLALAKNVDREGQPLGGFKFGQEHFLAPGRLLEISAILCMFAWLSKWPVVRQIVERRRFGELRLLKKRRQFQKRVPDSPRQRNADDEPVNEKFEPVIGRLIALSHGKRSAYGYRFCL